MKRVIWAILPLAIVACSHARVMPKANGDYVVVATSESESGAYDAALKKANKTCEQNKQHFVMVDHHSQYQGMDKNAQGVVDAIGAMNGYYGAGHRSDDNKVEMTFRCR